MEDGRRIAVGLENGVMKMVEVASEACELHEEGLQTFVRLVKDCTEWVVCWKKQDYHRRLRLRSRGAFRSFRSFRSCRSFRSSRSLRSLRPS